MDGEASHLFEEEHSCVQTLCRALATSLCMQRETFTGRGNRRLCIHGQKDGIGVYKQRIAHHLSALNECSHVFLLLNPAQQSSSYVTRALELLRLKRRRTQTERDILSVVSARLPRLLPLLLVQFLALGLVVLEGDDDVADEDDVGHNGREGAGVGCVACEVMLLMGRGSCCREEGGVPLKKVFLVVK